MIKVLVADDHKVFRDGITSILNEVVDITVIGQASDGNEVMQQLNDLQPHVILMDITMKETSGIDTTAMVKRQYPDTKVLVLTMHSEPAYILKMLEVGANGYLLKEAGREEMIRAIRTVEQGDNYYSKQVNATLVEQLTRPKKNQRDKKDIPLSKRELEILQLITEEYSNGEIAKKLFISVRTVDAHRRNLLEKTGSKNTVGLVRYALANGLIQ